MLNIKFHPSTDQPELEKAAKEYQEIWNAEGNIIVETIEKIGSLEFQEKLINAVVFEGISQSHPLCLRASYSREVKKATLIHELCHRLLLGNKIKVKFEKPEFKSLEIHRIIYLILYEIWTDLYGEDFAKRNVEVESGRDPKYKKAWSWALSFTKIERAKKFSELK